MKGNKIIKIVIMVMSFYLSSFALFINGGFENGNFDGWELWL